MRLLLDSHVVLWWLADDGALGEHCRREITDADEVFVSAVTPWEVGIKRALGKLDFPDGLVGAATATGFVMLAISAQHAECAPDLPHRHRDPFDRMLIAQAQNDSLVLATADEAMSDYEVDVLDARR